MKKISLFLLLVGQIYLVSAQAPTYTQWVDSIFQYVDKNQATTGILYERVMPFANLENFNRTQADTSSATHFMQAYSELYRAAWDTTKRLPSF